MDADLEREFSDFIEARSHALFRTALALTGHRQQAEDLLQTVLTKEPATGGGSAPETPRRTCAPRCTASRRVGGAASGGGAK